MAGDAALDEIDAAIVRELQNNARLANKDLARRVHLSPSSCLQRVRALERRGVITAYRAEISPHALGRNLDALIAVRLRGQSRQTLDAFEHAMMNLPETVMLAHVTGDDDALLRSPSAMWTTSRHLSSATSPHAATSPTSRPS